MEEKRNIRENWIDAAKAIAILIVVLNHSGLHIPGVNFWGGIFYVPIFFILSGYTYHPTEENFKDFVKKKARRLLSPYFIVNFILFAIFFVYKLFLAPADPAIGEGQFFYNIYFLMFSFFGILYGRSYLIRPIDNTGNFISNFAVMNILNSPMWFLPALFLTLVCGCGLYRRADGEKKNIFMVLGLWSMVMIFYCHYIPFLLPWCLDILPFLLLFFFVGHLLSSNMLLQKTEEASRLKKWVMIAACLLVGISCALFNGSYNLSVSYMGKSVFLCMLGAISISILLLLFLRWLEKKLPGFIKILGTLGKHTFAILCWHYVVLQGFFGAASAILGAEWRKNGLQNILICLTGIVVSIAVCICGELIYKNIFAQGGKIVGSDKKPG